MNKSKELKNLEKVWEGIVFNLKNFAKSHKQEDLHQFRVNVKKLKAWLTLFSYTGKNKDIFKEFQKVRKIFKLAGRIRDKFIKEELLNSYSGIEKGNITISDDLLKEIDDFSSKLEKFLKTIEKAKRKLSKQIQPISNADIFSFYSRELDQILITLAKKDFSENLHQCRMKIKNLIYNKKLSSHNIENKMKLDINYLNTLQEIIGQWHDAKVALKFFQSKKNYQPVIINKLRKVESATAYKIEATANDFWQKVNLS